MGFFSCFNVSVSDIFLLPRCDILTWAYQERNLKKGIDFCKSSDSKGAENKPLKSLKNPIAEAQNTEKSYYSSGNRKNE